MTTGAGAGGVGGGADAVLVGLGALAFAPATWWVSGVFPGGVAPDVADYLWQPVRLSTTAVTMLGITATAVIVLAAVRLRLLVRVGRVGRHWLHVAGAAAAFAAYLGLTYRVATTPVIGANIGGGALILGIVPAGLGALAWTAVALSNGRRANRRR